MAKSETRKRIKDTFAAHRTREQGYAPATDTITNFALKTGYNIDDIRKEKKWREMV